MKRFAILSAVAVFLMGASEDGCHRDSNPVSSSGVSQVSTRVKTGTDGMTVEQRNITKRLQNDNKPGSIKHLYVISAYSGQVIFYSTVDGKITSGGKRLSPSSVTDTQSSYPMAVNIGGYQKYTSEVIQDDGTYGSSMDYLYWFDSQGRYHQHYVTGGQIVHVSDEPIPVKSVIINLESRVVGADQ